MFVRYVKDIQYTMTQDNIMQQILKSSKLTWGSKFDIFAQQHELNNKDYQTICDLYSGNLLIIS